MDMEGAKLVSGLIQLHQPKEILDLRARKGYFSLLAASYGAHVDVVDDVSAHNEYPDYLKDHPNITFFDTTVENFEFKKKYDFIIMKHIVMYYKKEYIIENLLPKMYKYLNRWGMIFLTYHTPKSYLMQKEPWLYQYDLVDFKELGGYFMIKDFGEYRNPVSGEKNARQYVWYVVLQKV